jgi:hypothetical protein
MGRTAYLPRPRVTVRAQIAEELGMRLRILMFVVVTAFLSASVAVAKEGPRPGVPDDGATTACKPVRPLILKGTFLSGGTDSFQMEVRKANRHGRALRGTRELKVNAQTKFRRAGNAATLASLQPNDRLKVHVRACKSAQVPNMELMARRVVAHAPKSS